jgi:HEPN domain-containing protein
LCFADVFVLARRIVCIASVSEWLANAREELRRAERAAGDDDAVDSTYHAGMASAKAINAALVAEGKSPDSSGHHLIREWNRLENPPPFELHIALLDGTFTQIRYPDTPTEPPEDMANVIATTSSLVSWVEDQHGDS